MAFRDVLGHEKQIEQLQRAILLNRVVHSYLFWGNEGVGRKKVALEFAKTLNCLAGGPTPIEACDQCVSCRKIDRQIHPDVLLIEPDNQTIRKDQILQMQRELVYRPLEGRRRVCIVAAADRMAPHMANVLLKTLEEPPLHTVIILLAPHPRRLLPTIRSRCQPIRFASLPLEVVSKWLVVHEGLEPGEARLLASFSEGSPGRALELRDKVAHIPREEFLKEWVGAKGFSFETIERWVESLPTQREEVLLTLEVAKTLLRDLVVSKLSQDPSKLFHMDLAEKLEALASSWTLSALMKRLDALQRTIVAISPIRGNANPALAVEAMMLSWDMKSNG